jgi:hypothetical protein
MSNVAHTIDQLIEAVGATYQAIDIRSVAIRKDDSWLNVLAAVRFTYEDVETAKARLAKLSKRFPPVQTELLRIDSCVRSFAEWPDLRSELASKGVLRIGELEFQLRQRPDFNQPGYIQWGYSRLRPFDGRNWPAVTRDFDVGGNHPLIDGYGQFNRAAHLLGYADAFDAANALCEVNVSLQQDRGCDLSFSFPVFADISATRIDTQEKKINVEIKRHRAFSDIKIMACVRGRTVFADAPFREQITLSEVAMNESQDEIVSARGFAQCHDLDPDNDWLEVRLVHPRLGEVKNDSNYARTFIPASERNILLGAVRQFCKGTTLDDLLTRAYNVQAAKLKPSAAFELHVSWLLGMFGLSTVVLGEYESLLAPGTPVQRASIDLLATDQRSRLLLIVACTLNPPKEEDIGNLRYAREILAREIFAETGVRVIPVLFTSAMGCPVYYQSEDHFDSVPVIDADSMKTLLGFLDSGQESRFFQFLGNPTLGLTVSSQPR